MSAVNVGTIIALTARAQVYYCLCFVSGIFMKLVGLMTTPILRTDAMILNLVLSSGC